MEPTQGPPVVLNTESERGVLSPAQALYTQAVPQDLIRIRSSVHQWVCIASIFKFNNI